MLAVIMLACKFILRPNTDLLKNYDNQKIKENPLPPLDMQQKVIAGGFVVLIILMLLPSLIPVSTGVIGYLSGLTQGLPLVIVAILAAVPYKNKKVLDVQGVISTNFSFDTYFLCAAAILLGVALTNETTGISGFLASTIGPVFGGMNIMAFTITALIICMILTNFCNSLVIAMIFENIIANVCAVNGFDARPIVTLVILFTLQCALFTPAASPFAAVLHSNKRWFSKSELYKYTFFFIVVELIVILIVGIPLSNGITSIF
jgi:sodium-dependent dicarboxylate transporter 2/3/5